MLFSWYIYDWWQMKCYIYLFHSWWCTLQAPCLFIIGNNIYLVFIGFSFWYLKWIALGINILAYPYISYVLVSSDPTTVHKTLPIIWYNEFYSQCYEFYALVFFILANSESMSYQLNCMNQGNITIDEVLDNTSDIIFGFISDIRFNTLHVYVEIEFK